LAVRDDDYVTIGTFGSEGLIVSGSEVYMDQLTAGSSETNILVKNATGRIYTRSDLSLQGTTGAQGIPRYNRWNKDRYSR
jgi:hypothetical protein